MDLHHGERARRFVPEHLPGKPGARAIGDQTAVASSPLNLGGVASAEGDYKAARALHEQALELAREIGDQGVIAYAVDALGEDAREQGNLPAATAFYTESLALFQQLGLEAVANDFLTERFAAGDYQLARVLNLATLFAALALLILILWLRRVISIRLFGKRE
jgi:tetratricopeptide (TPR) repeat protein